MKVFKVPEGSALNEVFFTCHIIMGKTTEFSELFCPSLTALFLIYTHSPGKAGKILKIHFSCGNRCLSSWHPQGTTEIPPDFPDIPF
ncbi:MAG: hypothetical protein LIP16_11895 [Clostridium sp.]|nr:hypothetical protein [Clostridium sp.]